MATKIEKERFREMVEKWALIRGEVTLASGEKSAYYYDLKRVILNPKGGYLAGKLVLDLIPREGISCVGGYGLGGQLLAYNVMLVSGLENRPIDAFSVLTESQIEEDGLQLVGIFSEGDVVAFVEDVVTKGGSIIKGIKIVEAAGGRVAKVVALLDRQQGGSERLREMGYDFSAILRSDAVGNLYINE